MSPRIVVLQHEPADPPLRLGEWLVDAGADVTVRRLFAGDALPVLAGDPGDPGEFDALVSLGGEVGAHDDAAAPWLPATRALLAAAVDRRLPALGICLGAQLLAAATGGRVERGRAGPEIGAYLTAKRDAARDDPLFRDLPMTPDVMHYHYDVIAELPPGAVLLLSATGYPHQAFRVGPAAWGVQFHLEPTAAAVRDWARAEGLPIAGRLGPMLDEAEAEMTDVWSAFTDRFVQLARRPVPPRLPLLGGPP